MLITSTGLVHVEGAEQIPASTPQEVMKIFAKGSSRRAVASTQMNAESSRSHLICTLVVKLRNKKTDSETQGNVYYINSCFIIFYQIALCFYISHPLP